MVGWDIIGIERIEKEGRIMDQQKIVILKGPDRVRKRPAVIFGADDITGVESAVTSLLEIFATEAQLGYCKNITVRQNGAVLEISGDDRGLYLGQDKQDDSVWQNIFCDFFAGSAYAPDDSGYSFGLTDSSHHHLYGDEKKINCLLCPEEPCFMELCAVQYASNFMDVTVVRDDIKSVLHFQKGYNVGGICREQTVVANGTCLRFEPDGEVFTETVIPTSFFADILQRFAILSPGLKCTYINMQNDVQWCFCYPGGITEYVTGGKSTPVYSRAITAKGKDRYNRAEYEACVQLAIGLAPGEGEFSCLHNFKDLTAGGSHCEVAKEGICDAFWDAFRKDFEEQAELSYEEIGQHFRVVLVSWCSPRCTQWENGTRKSICNKMITDMAEDLTGRELENHIYREREAYRPVIEAMIKKRAN